MNVEIITATPHPVDVISAAAGTCYGKQDMNPKRVRNCFKSGHMSVFEHASATFRVSGISRACSHQLVRHRVASYSQQSQRYCKVDVESRDWYVVPPEIAENKRVRLMYDGFMMNSAAEYSSYLKAGFKPEDARYILPEATKTEIVVSMNARELFHFIELRTSQAAQWEIRDLAGAMVDALSAYDRQWRELLAMRTEVRR
jgi:thymidylate synthase (FAD)